MQEKIQKKNSSYIFCNAIFMSIKLTILCLIDCRCFPPQPQQFNKGVDDQNNM